MTTKELDVMLTVAAYVLTFTAMIFVWTQNWYVSSACWNGCAVILWARCIWTANK